MLEGLAGFPGKRRRLSLKATKGRGGSFIHSAKIPGSYTSEGGQSHRLPHTLTCPFRIKAYVWPEDPAGLALTAC